MPGRISYFTAIKINYDRTESAAERKRFYSGRKWRALRELFLRSHPVCGCGQLADTVHHIIPRLSPGGEALAYTWSNLEQACASCHSAHHLAERRKGKTGTGSITPNPNKESQ